MTSPENVSYGHLTLSFLSAYRVDGIHQNTRKVTKPNFYGKTPVGPNLSKKGQKWPNIFSKLSHYFWLKCWKLWLGCMVHHPYAWENSHLAKFWAKRPESSRPIRLLHFQNAITSKPFDRFLTMRGINRKYLCGN